MIAACPKCSARYRIERDRLGPEGARLRCTRCEAIFRVRAPAPEPPPAAAEPRDHGYTSPDAEPAPAADRERLVLIADPVIDEGKATASTLASWGLQPLLVHDGVEAVLTIQRTLPRAVIIDAALPKMYGFQICELLKRNESLRAIQVVLVGAIHDRNRYRRSPTELYGADAYLERQQLPDALRPILQAFGIPLRSGSAPAASEPAKVSAKPAAVASPEPPAVPPSPAPSADVRPPPAPVEVPEASAPPAPASATASEVAKAERLARIVVSDIVLYNQEKFDAAVQSGDVVGAMDAELAEGRTLFAQRIEAGVRESRDFLTEELLRIAALRRSK